ncbi:MAG: hypothetical protein V2G49_06515, partial [bacterium JZ-2024 1]
CQLEAVETLIWLTEAPAAERVGIEIPGDGGGFVRQCCKMATGTGKTMEFRRTANGSGRMMCETANIPEIGKLYDTSLIGYDPCEGKLHRFSGDNFGTAHDHTGELVSKGPYPPSG